MENPNPIVFETNTYSVLDNGNTEWYVDGGVIISDNGNSIVVQ